MSTSATEPLPECAIADLEPVVTELRATTMLLGSMIISSARDHGFSERERDAWDKLDRDLTILTEPSLRTVEQGV